MHMLTGLHWVWTLFSHDLHQSLKSQWHSCTDRHALYFENERDISKSADCLLPPGQIRGIQIDCWYLKGTVMCSSKAFLRKSRQYAVFNDGKPDAASNRQFNGSEMTCFLTGSCHFLLHAINQTISWDHTILSTFGTEHAEFSFIKDKWCRQWWIILQMKRWRHNQSGHFSQNLWGNYLMVVAHWAAKVSTQQLPVCTAWVPAKPLPVSHNISQESPLMNTPSVTTGQTISFKHTPLCPPPVFAFVKQPALMHWFLQL